MNVLKRLAELNIELPPPPRPAATYVTVRREGNLVYVSGQGPMVGAEPTVTGKVGAEVTEEQAYDAARLAVLNGLAAIHHAVGLDKIQRMVRLTGWVSSANDFHRQHVVVDGASDLLIKIFGDNGQHTRCALGVNVLPFNIPVEIELTAVAAE
ncbi:RidA family protein [Burkholderia sp. Ax-1719]|uniref:RidA family protein n=1 Tax=Burkholderia sp. Ax-1719 TaxID=2608334 RepID=UPI001421C19B|nr:RidA family protein [Burkholderia sp. Ax-1719]NIE66924.1 RidA family protein [Burkholderia sp. Ax-1719]